MSGANRETILRVEHSNKNCSRIVGGALAVRPVGEASAPPLLDRSGYAIFKNHRIKTLLISFALAALLASGSPFARGDVPFQSGELFSLPVA
jgi:hypothetical protein